MSAARAQDRRDRGIGRAPAGDAEARHDVEKSPRLGCDLLEALGGGGRGHERDRVEAGFSKTLPEARLLLRRQVHEDHAVHARVPSLIREARRPEPDDRIQVGHQDERRLVARAKPAGLL